MNILHELHFFSQNSCLPRRKSLEARFVSFHSYMHAAEAPQYFILFHLTSSALFTSKINDNSLAKTH